MSSEAGVFNGLDEMSGIELDIVINPEDESFSQLSCDQFVKINPTYLVQGAT